MNTHDNGAGEARPGCLQSVACLAHRHVEGCRGGELDLLVHTQAEAEIDAACADKYGVCGTKSAVAAWMAPEAL